MDVEEVLERVNGWGRYQKVIYFFACLPSIIAASVTIGYSWTAYVMDHRCLIDGCEDPSNATYDAPFLNYTTPPDADHEWSRCESFKRSSPNGCHAGDFSQQTEKCSHWVYDTSVMKNTVVSEFDLVCDDESLQPLGSSLFFAGIGVGSILAGIVADRYGRKIALVGGAVLTALTSGGAAFAPNYATFTALRFLAAIFQYGLFSVPFVLCTELTSVNVRAFCGIMINAFFAVGEALVGVFPIFVKEWMALQLIYSLPALLFTCYWLFIPESPRWLMVVNKPHQAENVLRNIAKWNGTTFPEDLVKKENSVEESKGSHTSETFIGAMKHSILRKRAGILCIQWFVVSMVYYGIGMVSTSLGGDIYVDFILTMLIEIPSYLFCAFTVNPLGRKLVIGGAFALSGLGTICAGLVMHHSADWVTTVLSLVGKFGAASAFSLMYLYTAELYPTAIRSVGVGVASTCGRVGSILAPFISDLGHGSATLPLCIFGVSGLVASAVTVFLPETSGHDLPNNIAEAASFGKGQPLLPIPCLLARRGRRQAELSGYDGPQKPEETSTIQQAPLSGYDGPQQAEETSTTQQAELSGYDGPQQAEETSTTQQAELSGYDGPQQAELSGYDGPQQADGISTTQQAEQGAR